MSEIRPLNDQNTPRKSSGSRVNDLHQEYSLLILDENQVNLKNLQKTFTKANYKDVKIANSKAGALEMIKQNSFDIVIIESNIGSIFSFLEQIRAFENTVNTAIIVVSNTDNPTEISQGLKAGADHILSKPIKEESLKIIQQISKKKKTETEEKTQLIMKCNTVESELSNSRQQMESFIQIIFQEAENYLCQNSSNEEFLSSLVKNLQSVDICHQKFQEYFNNSVKLKPEVQKWLLTFLATEKNKRTKKWPSIQLDTQSISNLKKFEFEAKSCNIDQLFVFIHQMFQNFKLLDIFKIPIDSFQNFLFEVADTYRKNEYHNFVHAFDVTQASYFFLTTCESAHFFNNLEIFALLVASLCHDLDHPGLSNQFLILTSSPLAMTYNDISVLESYHCSLAFSILSKPKCNILVGLTNEQKREFREFVIPTILATDLAKHWELTEKWNVIKEKFDKTQKTHRILLSQILIKTADISNPARPWTSAEYWAIKIQEEFFIQGDLEKKNNLKVSPYMDKDQPNLPLMQIDFIDKLVLSLFQSLTKLLPNVQPCCDNLANNKKQWQKKINSKLP